MREGVPVAVRVWVKQGVMRRVGRWMCVGNAAESRM